jgi:hypothetical protein
MCGFPSAPYRWQDATLDVGRYPCVDLLHSFWLYNSVFGKPVCIFKNKMNSPPPPSRFRYITKKICLTVISGHVEEPHSAQRILCRLVHPGDKF